MGTPAAFNSGEVLSRTDRGSTDSVVISGNGGGGVGGSGVGGSVNSGESSVWGMSDPGAGGVGGGVVDSMTRM